MDGRCRQGMEWRRGWNGRGYLAIVALVAVALGLLGASPLAALAKSYEMTEVRIEATVRPDGDVEVVEYRTFDFDGSFSSVHWDVPVANSQGVEVLGAGEAQGAAGATSDYSLRSGASQAGTYSVDNQGDEVVTTLKFSKEDESATFWVRYVVQGGAKAWADTGDVTWQAVGPGWEEPSKNVTVTLTLPVPLGAQAVLGENVRAWADGPLDGVVSQAADGALVFSCPQVNAGQYLSVMVAFPVEWLSAMAPSDKAHLAAMEEMGREVAEAANAQRSRARVLLVGASVLSVLVAGGAVIFLLRKYRSFGKEYVPHFDDTYWRDVPSNDHPAVIGSLWRWGTIKDEDLTATLMRLTDEGAVHLERVTSSEKGFLGRTKTVDDYSLQPVEGYPLERLHPIDRAAYDLVFQGNPMPEGVLFSEFGQQAKADPQGYHDRYEAWKTAVQTAANARSFYEASGELWRGRAQVTGVVLAVLALASLVFIGVVGVVPVAVLAIAAVVSFAIASKMPRRSREANEIAAKTEALRRWLTDFTNLKEAVPTDVVLWDKLLVLAVVLGVSDRVIEQLRAAAPQVLEDPMVAPIYLWYMPYGMMGSPMQVFDSSVSEAHQLSSMELAQTLDSSSSGGFGGFGGGGFGGSFGGGSFGGGGGGAN